MFAQSSLTRRALLAALPISLAAQTASRYRTKTKPLPSVGEFFRFSDPTTEATVVRLTSLNSASFLPAPTNRFVSVKDRFLIFSSDRTGALCPFQVDLRSGAIHHLADTTELAPQSLSLDPKERWLYFLEGARLLRIDVARRELRHLLPRPLAEDVQTFSIASNGAIFYIKRSNGDLLHWTEESDARPALKLAASAGPLCLAQPAGGGAGCLFTRDTGSSGREFWYAPANSSSPVLLAKGRISEPFWSPNGLSVLFLRDVSTPTASLAEIHEVTLDGKPERCVTPTSQFASFSPNFDASVFVGASRSKAQPNIVLLLRSARREMTLCQHHASRPASVLPVFSPDARRVYFQSDEEGKEAIYSVNVELLVEPPTDKTDG